MESFQSYHDLIAISTEELGDNETLQKRKLWCDTLPEPVVAVISKSVQEKQKKVMELEKEIDAMLDFLNGFHFLDLLDIKRGGDDAQ